MASMLFCRGWYVDLLCFIALFMRICLPALLHCSSNLLYAKEDKAAKKLMYICQKCQYSQAAENPVVYRHELVRNVT